MADLIPKQGIHHEDLGPYTRQFLERVIDERDKLYNDRFKALEKLIDERDRLYDSRFKAAEVAVSAALAAQEKAVNAAFTASEKAVLKAEQAQKEYNERSNEFRGQLDDQAKTLMPRPETLNMFKSIEEKLVAAQVTFKSEMSAVQSSFEKTVSGLEAQVSSLRDSRSQGSGRDAAIQSNTSTNQWTVGIVVVVIVSVIEIVSHFIK
jgi:chromosome segregation ATPase